MFLSISSLDVGEELAALNKKLGQLMATFDQVRADYRAYAQELKNQRDAAIAAAQTAQEQAQANADALAAFVEDDAATDATQLADQARELADQLQSDLDELRGAPEPEEPVIEEPPAEELPPESPETDEPHVEHR